MNPQKNNIQTVIQISSKARFIPSSTKSNKRSTTSIPTFAQTINKSL